MFLRRQGGGFVRICASYVFVQVTGKLGNDPVTWQVPFAISISENEGMECIEAKSKGK